MGAASLYLRYLGISVRAQLQYRVSLILFTVGNLLVTGLEFLSIWILFERFGTLEGFTLPEVGLLFGMANISFAIAEAGARGFDMFSEQVKSGDFDRLLLRPRATAFQVAAQDLQIMRVGRLAQGAVVLLWAVFALQTEWSAAKAALLLVSVAAGVSIFSGLFVLQATLSFWTTETLEMMAVVTYGGVQTAQYPLAIYAKWFRRFFTFVVPLACLNYLPSIAITGHAAGGPVPSWVPWTAPLFGLAFFPLSLLVWRYGVRHYRSTGS